MKKLDTLLTESAGEVYTVRTGSGLLLAECVSQDEADGRCGAFGGIHVAKEPKPETDMYNEGLKDAFHSLMHMKKADTPEEAAAKCREAADRMCRDIVKFDSVTGVQAAELMKSFSKFINGMTGLMWGAIPGAGEHVSDGTYLDRDGIDAFEEFYRHYPEVKDEVLKIQNDKIITLWSFVDRMCALLNIYVNKLKEIKDADMNG